jgi:hypothetical protein
MSLVAFTVQATPEVSAVLSGLMTLLITYVDEHVPFCPTTPISVQPHACWRMSHGVQLRQCVATCTSTHLVGRSFSRHSARMPSKTVRQPRHQSSRTRQFARTFTPFYNPPTRRREQHGFGFGSTDTVSELPSSGG